MPWGASRHQQPQHHVAHPAFPDKSANVSFWGDFVAIPGVNGNKATATKANFSWIGDTGYNPDCAVGGVLTSGGIIGVAPPG